MASFFNVFLRRDGEVMTGSAQLWSLDGFSSLKLLKNVNMDRK